MYWVPIIAMSPNDFMNPTCHQRAIPSGIPIESYTGSQAIGMVVIVTHVLELRIMLVTGTHVVHCCTKLTNTSTCKQRHGTFIQNITLSFNGTLLTLPTIEAVWITLFDNTKRTLGLTKYAPARTVKSLLMGPIMKDAVLIQWRSLAR